MPVDNERIKFAWKEEQSVIYPAEIKLLSFDVIKHAKFTEKLAWFRYNLEELRISWEQGCQTLKVDRWNILFSSLDGLKGINCYKELKIQFTDEKVDDAGGLLREWMHLCVK
jgi:E3 ubiquitin-protein ligase HUWE1